MSYVLIDTNSLMENYLLTGAAFETLFRGCQRCSIQVCFPEVVVDELIGNFRKDITRFTNRYRDAGKKLGSFGITAEISDFDVAKLVDEYETHVRATMRRYDVRQIPYPDFSPKDLVQASYAGRKPFKDTGEGFKDFLIFHSLKLCAADDSGEGWFVTANRKDFCGSDGGLHAHLHSDLPDSANVTVIDKIADFNSKVLSLRLEALDDIAERIRRGDFEGFDLDEKLTDLFIKELCEGYSSIEDTGTPVEDASTVGVGKSTVDTLHVSRLSEEDLFFDIKGTVELEVSGFIPKSWYYAATDEDMSGIYIDDADWNDYVMSAGTTTDFQFSMSVIFDETKELVESVSIEVEPVRDH